MCPFVEMSDPRCAAHLTMRNIAWAYTHCADCYSECQVYLELVLEDVRHEKANTAVPLLAAS